MAGIASNRLFTASIAILRVYFGIVYLTNGLAKLIPGISSTPFGFLIDSAGARNIIASEAHRNPVTLYRDLIEQIVLPNWWLFGPTVGITETVAGLLLLLGVGSTLGALIAAALALHLQFATLWNGKWLYEYSLEWVPLLCLAGLRAGRFYGLDNRMIARYPRLSRFL
jgi:uncharacterized membrane protein YphA (DoxX/SURF4 family)